MKPRTYAVVDIETTGTNPKEDRIIQFGCVMIESGRITSRFSIDIHPGRKISKQIQHLTGITNQRVQKAPYFEDVAQTIYNLLADTIFVAHNIYFDYNFLNHELMRCGLPSLKIPGIDTVELAQIFLPTEPSFRLADLSESLGFIHENPHQADSDAEVTGQLLLLIEERMRKLPIITLEQIARLSRHTGMDTSRFIYHVIEEMKEKPEPLDPSLEIVDGLALQKKEVELFTSVHYGERTYPRKKQAKEKMFGKTLMYRKEQNRLMNAVYDHFTKDESKDLEEVAYIKVRATYDVDAVHSKGDDITPEDTEFDLDNKSIKVQMKELVLDYKEGDKNYEDHLKTYPGYSRAAKLLESIATDKEKFEKIAIDIVKEIFEKNVDDIFEMFIKENK